MHVEPELHRSLDRAIDDLLAQGSWTVEGLAGSGRRARATHGCGRPGAGAGTPHACDQRDQKAAHLAARRAGAPALGRSGPAAALPIRACARLPARHAGAATAAMAAGLGPRPLEGVRR